MTLWIDDAFFDGRDDMKYDMNDIFNNYSAIAAENPECFVPLSGLKFIKKHSLNSKLKINYLLISNNYKDFGYRNFDLCHCIPSFTTVVQYAILIAIYMGFSEIYLLGCDSTGIVTTINCALNESNSEMHAYDNDNSEKELNELLQHWKMSEVFKDQYYLFGGYEYLYDYCQKHNIKLVNCSDKTLITSIPRKRLSDVLGE